MARLNQNNSENLVTSTTAASKGINWNPPFQAKRSLLIKSTSKCEHCKVRFTSEEAVFEDLYEVRFEKGDADSRPLSRHVGRGDAAY